MIDLIVITGASKGIGKSIAESLYGSCNNMLVISHSDELMKLNTDKCKLHRQQSDLSDYTETYSTVYNNVLTKLKENINSIGIVLCGAKLGDPGGLLINELNIWEDIFKSNVLGNLAVVKACVEYCGNIKTRIAFFAGGGAAFGYPEFFAYSLSKVAIVRAAENLSLELKNKQYTDTSVISIAPGAVDTAMLKKVIAAGTVIRTKTDILEPTNFVKKFLLDEFDSKKLNGRFLHVRDDLTKIDNIDSDIFKLRRTQ